jgi:nucleoside-diphosphate-sugar epimerase
MSFPYQNIFVAGASKGVGRCIVDQLVSSSSYGGTVTCLVREESVAATLNAIPGVVAIVGNAFDQKTVENAMNQCDAAITTLGGTTTIEDGSIANGQRIDYVGNNNVIESAGILGITRVILVTSIGCGNSQSAVSEKTYEVLKDVLLAKTKAENILIKYYTNMNWTIVRPGGLVTEPATHHAILTQDASHAIGSIRREDVAELVIKILADTTGTTQRQIYSAIDPTIPSAANPEEKVFAAVEL